MKSMKPTNAGKNKPSCKLQPHLQVQSFTLTYLVSPWTIRLHLWALETLSGNLGSEHGACWKLRHVNALSKVNKLEAAMRPLQY